MKRTRASSRKRTWGPLATVLVTLGLGGSYAWGNAGIVYDNKNDGPQNQDYEIDIAEHMHQSETRLEHTVYVLGKAKVRNPPNIYFETTDDEKKSGLRFRRVDGKTEIVKRNGTRSHPAEVKRINAHGLFDRFQEGAIGSLPGTGGTWRMSDMVRYWTAPTTSTGPSTTSRSTTSDRPKSERPSG